MEQYCLYLRKSRADADAEARGEGETLARHEKALLDVAKRLKLSITHIHREIVSGETIAARPVMQQLLSEVEQGVWAGVLVMEVERLARGDTIDQGIVAQTFKFSDTKIITPLKTYDPANEYDEEYFEFGLFMSRREYKTINRRLQRGRLASVKEGKYVASVAPYGYTRVRLSGDKGWTLAPNEEEAVVVRLIFDLYTKGEAQPDGSVKRLGASLIVRRLNQMGLKPRHGGKSWSMATVRDILINPVYAGKIRWNWRKTSKRMVDGEVQVSRPRTDYEEVEIHQGKQPPLVSEETFAVAQQIMSQNPPRPVGENKEVRNSLAGIIVCGMCGKRMVRRPKGPRQAYDVIMCADTACKNVSVRMELLEERVIDGLADWLSEYRLKWDLPDASSGVSLVDAKKKQLDKLEKDIVKLEAQLARTHDFLEQGVYDVDTFLLRSKEVSQRIADAKSDMTALSAEIGIELMREKSAADIIPTVEKLLDTYRSLPTAQAKNDMLKDVLEKVVYIKEKNANFKGVSPDDFEITLYPKLPAAEPQ